MHALFPETFTLTTLPSAQVGIQNTPSPTREGTTLLNIQNPDSISEDSTPLPPLPDADVESAYIARCVSHALTLPNTQATHEAVTQHLKTANATLFHFTGHASYNDKHPQRSALYLSQQERLTVQTLSQLNLSTYELACLSACETGTTGREAFENDYVGISSAFLAQGVSHVIATLWTVESEASALFMMRFYEQRQHHPHLSDIVLFNQIQRWFKQVAYGELWQWYEAILAGLESDESTIQPMLVGTLLSRGKKSPEDSPYSHPYYWAAFTISGT
ncbi:CHAT domain-containing protein [Roseofilum reptotaenium CS-1145]|nr:CHAT domain-containing protein [Roseofilum reptotaenium]MDB9517127.1 CHAT domain-containing protein [Roseofilum reptotaenium CS-1145]